MSSADKMLRRKQNIKEGEYQGYYIREGGQVFETGFEQNPEGNERMKM